MADKTSLRFVGVTVSSDRRYHSGPLLGGVGDTDAGGGEGVGNGVGREGVEEVEVKEVAREKMDSYCCPGISTLEPGARL